MDRLVAFYERVFEAQTTADDPDGAAHEVILERPGYDDADVFARAAWTMVTLD
jgi:hypothetical protein